MLYHWLPVILISYTLIIFLFCYHWINSIFLLSSFKKCFVFDYFLMAHLKYTSVKSTISLNTCTSIMYTCRQKNVYLHTSEYYSIAFSRLHSAISSNEIVQWLPRNLSTLCGRPAWWSAAPIQTTCNLSEPFLLLNQSVSVCRILHRDLFQSLLLLSLYLILHGIKWIYSMVSIVVFIYGKDHFIFSRNQLDNSIIILEAKGSQNETRLFHNLCVNFPSYFRFER